MYKLKILQWEFFKFTSVLFLKMHSCIVDEWCVCVLNHCLVCAWNSLWGSTSFKVGFQACVFDWFLFACERTQPGWLHFNLFDNCNCNACSWFKSNSRSVQSLSSFTLTACSSNEFLMLPRPSAWWGQQSRRWGIYNIDVFIYDGVHHICSEFAFFRYYIWKHFEM